MTTEKENEYKIQEIKIGKFRMGLKFIKLFLFTIFRTKWFIPGVSETTVDELKDLIESNNAPLIVDTRDRIEFYAAEGSWRKYGHIQGSKCVPIMELTANLQNLSSYKDKKIVTICPGGGMSLVAAEIMAKAGFTDVYSLKKGIDHWDRLGYPTVTGEDLGVSVEDIKAMTSESEAKTTNILKLPAEEYSGEIHQTVDARNFNCPVPVIKSKKALDKLKTGQVLEILTTDPGSKRDIPAWAHVTGQELISVEDSDLKEFRFIIKKIK